MFNSDDWVKILVGLRFEKQHKEIIQQAMAAIETDSPELVAEIQQKLVDLGTINTIITREQSSANSALIRADVLEWSKGNRSNGMFNRRRELQTCIFNLLNLAQFGLSMPGIYTATQPGTSSSTICVNYGW